MPNDTLHEPLSITSPRRRPVGRSRGGRAVTSASGSLAPDARAQRDPLAVIAAPIAPIVLEGRYRLLVSALWRFRSSRRGRWTLAAGSGGSAIVLALLAARHFATTSWPLSSGRPVLLLAA